MEAIALESSTREGRGKGAARRLRAAGRVPAVIYGHGVDEPVAVSLDPKALDTALANPKGDNAVFKVTVDDGAGHTVLVRELQRHPVSRKILHLDLVSPDLEQPIVTAVPLEFSGKSVGVVTGGRLRTPYREVRLRAKPGDVPASIAIDITPLDMGDAITISQLDLPAGVEAIYERDYVIVKVMKPRGKKAEPGAEDDKKKKKK